MRYYFSKMFLFHDITIDSPSLGPGHYLSLVCGAGSEEDRMVFRGTEWDQS